ncbi:unnamed protein product [Lathyrus oleraceus]
MKETRKVNEESFKYFWKIPPGFWGKSRFNYNNKCDVLVNNMSETFNSVIIGSTQKPIITMLEDIIGHLMDRWVTNKNKIEAYNGSTLPRIKKVLERQTEISRFYMARLVGDMIYEVRHINVSRDKFTVDLKQKECSCRSWMLTGISCYHEIVCIQSIVEDLAYYVATMYRKETYLACYIPIIYPTNGQNLWEETSYPNILPPPSRRAQGRPKIRRNSDVDEKRKDTTTISRQGLPNKCSLCSKSGHNKAFCPTAPKQQASSHPAPSQLVPSQPASSQTQPTIRLQTKLSPRETQHTNSQSQP